MKGQKKRRLGHLPREERQRWRHNRRMKLMYIANREKMAAWAKAVEPVVVEVLRDHNK